MREETFNIPFDSLVRRVVPRKGAPYEHTCSKRVYEYVALAIDHQAGAPFTGESIRDYIMSIPDNGDAPFTQVMVAMAFLKERGCIVPADKRRHHAASDWVYEDALIEWHALREGSPGSAAARGEVV
ncbi:MAG: hypothetical protein KF724_13385 [Phycisphaeraceae bacterium]|nr:hypothetical protein [Phycisphaeraceae bacterium]